MEQLKSMKQCLTAQVQAQMGNLQTVDTKELGEAIDMLKDLSEAIYYCTITEAMEKKEEEPAQYNYYTEMYYDPRRDKYDWDRMYYSSGMGSSSSRGSRSGGTSGMGGSSSNNGSRNYYTEREFPMEWRDEREGRSPMSRKMYMESKELKHDKNSQMKELENYMQELSRDITEMIQGASPEEKQMLQKKLSSLAMKIDQ